MRLGALLLVMLLSGCGVGTNVLTLDPSARAAKTSESVEVLWELPDRPYIKLAYIDTDEAIAGTSWDKHTAAIRKRAAEMGADAVIMGSRQDRQSGAMWLPIGDAGIIATSSERVLSAVAIAWGPE